ncbi:Extradiol ring-cleavage dioxygenase, class III enzyme, subunit B [Bimuria novae-zelandiae CBS 107.79]|uniref:Extradiol ring-cleavage dioxygenase, class III enzyme, subunit B n=1 Tax=Bimuria novae-zelandiae CBS 107.79 TaxID=1447943 RepID=A0A6A5VG54_9PLEO|nr:Extradiol ring-cleavage dioxygenase, class III enzyme, subunit B [Bimuria novae-zelandiae CBS 107.79]
MRLSRTFLRIAPLIHTSAFSTSQNSTLNPLRGIQQFPLAFYSTTTISNMTRLAPVICISHGGGPLPLLGDPSQAQLTHSLKTRVPKILKLGTPEQPKAIVLVTAHWSTTDVTISSGEKPALYYDYHGFPDEAYRLRYDAPGSPEVAELVRRQLEEAGIKGRKDATRGWDHGVFVPMTLIHPEATIPIVQLSVLRSEDPVSLFAIGRALAPLRAQNIAIIGSGFASLHNMRAMFLGQTSIPSFKSLHEEWSKAVGDAVTTQDVEAQKTKFEGWRKWPGAYDMHPRGGAEHFLPLIVCAGAGSGSETKARAYADEMLGLQMWSYYWDESEEDVL